VFRSYLSWRYMFARRTNLIGMIGIFVAVGALILILSIMTGFLEESRKTVRGSLADILIEPYFEQTIGSSRPVPRDPQPLLDAVRTDPRVRGATAQLVWGGIITQSGRSFERHLSNPTNPGLLAVQLIGVDIRTLDRLARPATYAAARAHGARSVAYTYNDPVIFHEYAVDVAMACREAGIKNVAVSAGYVLPDPRAEFYAHMDAANIDLKAFTDEFYFKLTAGHLAPVLDTLQYIKHETNTWLEVTTLLIPGANDSDHELDEMTQWLFTHLGPEVPIHFSAFHPDWKMMDTPPTPAATLNRARDLPVAGRRRLQRQLHGQITVFRLSHVLIGQCAVRSGESRAPGV